MEVRLRGLRAFREKGASRWGAWALTSLRALWRILVDLCALWEHAEGLITTSQAQTPHPPFSSYGPSCPTPCHSLLSLEVSPRRHKSHFLTLLKTCSRNTGNGFPLCTPALTFFLPVFFSLALNVHSWHCLGVADIPVILANGHSRSGHQYSNNCCREIGIFICDYSDKSELELTYFPGSVYLPLYLEVLVPVV